MRRTGQKTPADARFQQVMRRKSNLLLWGQGATSNALGVPMRKQSARDL